MPHSQNLFVPSATLDTGIFHPVRNALGAKSSVPKELYSCLASPERMTLYVLGFAAVYRSGEGGSNQLMYALISALFQRRSLGFPHHFIFGIASVGNGKFQGWAATWVESEVRPILLRFV